MRCTAATSSRVVCWVSCIWVPACAARREPLTTWVILPFMLLTASAVSDWMLRTRALICDVELRELSARRCTSSATTAKPRPASPAAAACILAFSASTWVRSAILLMMSMMPLISCDRSLSRLMRFSVSLIASRISSMDSMVVLTASWALSVEPEAFCAITLQAWPHSAIWFICCEAASSFLMACTTSRRSWAATLVTLLVCSSTRTLDASTRSPI